MSKEIKNTNTEEKKDNKKKYALILLAALLLFGAAGVPIYMAGQKSEAKPQASVELKDEAVPMAASVADAKDEADKTENSSNAAGTTGATDVEETTGTDSAAANGVLGERRIITDPTELTAEADAIGALLAALPTTETVAAPAAGGTAGTPATDDEEARRQQEEAARQQQIAAAAAARVQALKNKVDALRRDLEGVSLEYKHAAVLAKELAGATEEFKAAVDDANKKLEDAKAAAVAAANASGAGLEVLNKALTDENSVVYKYFKEVGKSESDSLTASSAKTKLDSTGNSWGIGDAKKPTDKQPEDGKGASNEVIEAVKTDASISQEAKDLLEKELPDSKQDANYVNPGMAFKALQWKSETPDKNGNYVKYSLVWSPNFDSAPVGGKVPVYFINAEGDLFVGEIDKVAGTYTSGTQLKKNVYSGDFTTKIPTTGENSAEKFASAVAYLQGVKYNDADPTLITGKDAVNTAAGEVANIVNDELMKTLTELAAAEGKPLSQVADENHVTLPSTTAVTAMSLEAAPAETAPAAVAPVAGPAPTTETALTTETTSAAPAPAAGPAPAEQPASQETSAPEAAPVAEQTPVTE